MKINLPLGAVIKLTKVGGSVSTDFCWKSKQTKLRAVITSCLRLSKDFFVHVRGRDYFNLFWVPASLYKFSLLVSIHFVEYQLRELVYISRQFIFGAHFPNSHDIMTCMFYNALIWWGEILMLITIGTERVKGIAYAFLSLLYYSVSQRPEF